MGIPASRLLEESEWSIPLQFAYFISLTERELSTPTWKIKRSPREMVNTGGFANVNVFRPLLSFSRFLSLWQNSCYLCITLKGYGSSTEQNHALRNNYRRNINQFWNQ